MHRSSETIGAIAAALAKAQGELTNPRQSLIAIIRSPFPREGDRTFSMRRSPAGLKLSANASVSTASQRSRQLPSTTKPGKSS